MIDTGHSKFDKKPIFEQTDVFGYNLKQVDFESLEKRDDKYTQQAIEEGKPFYKWDTERMAALILKDGIDENGESSVIYGPIAYYIAMEGKFIENEQYQKLMQNFYEKGEHKYLEPVNGPLGHKTIYRVMRSFMAPYIYSLFRIYKPMNPNLEDMYLYFKKLRKEEIDLKIPNEKGDELINVETYKDVQKYLGTWISPERKKEIEEITRKRIEKFKNKGGFKND